MGDRDESFDHLLTMCCCRRERRTHERRGNKKKGHESKLVRLLESRPVQWLFLSLIVLDVICIIAEVPTRFVHYDQLCVFLISAIDRPGELQSVSSRRLQQHLPSLHPNFYVRPSFCHHYIVLYDITISVPDHLLRIILLYIALLKNGGIVVEMKCFVVI